MVHNGWIFDLVSGQQILFGFFSFGSRMQTQSSFTCKKSDVNWSFVKSYIYRETPQIHYHPITQIEEEENIPLIKAPLHTWLVSYCAFMTAIIIENERLTVQHASHVCVHLLCKGYVALHVCKIQWRIQRAQKTLETHLCVCSVTQSNLSYFSGFVPRWIFMRKTEWMK